MSDSYNRRNRILELLYDNAVEGIHIADLLGGELTEQNEDLWRGTLRSLDRDGLIHLSETMGFGGTSAFINDEGLAYVEAWRKRRDNPAERREAASRGILQYLYQEDPDGTRWIQFRGDEGVQLVFEGVRLPDSLVGRVAEQLKEAGLLEGGSYVAELNGPLAARLTALGQKCVESGVSVDEFLHQQKPQTGNTITIGSVHGSNLNWGDHVTQNATTTTGMVGDEIRLLGQAIVDALPALNLTDDQAAAVRRDAEIIEGELQRQTPESQGIVRSMMKRTLDTIQSEASNQLGVYLVTTAKQVLKNVGIDVE